MLTEEQIEAVWNSVKTSPWPLHSVELNQSIRHKFARAIEKALLATTASDSATPQETGEAK